MVTPIVEQDKEVFGDYSGAARRASSLDIIAKAQQKIAQARDVSVASTSVEQKKTETVKAMVHHKESSQVGSVEDSATAELTESASEGEMEKTNSKSKSFQEEISDGFWTLVGGKRRKSSVDEGDTIKIGVGNFVNSFLGSNTQRSKKKKEEFGEGGSNQKASS